MRTDTTTRSFRSSRPRVLALVGTFVAAPTVIAGVGNAAEQTILVPNVLDLGQCAAGGTANGSMWIINTNDVPITVVSAKGTCGCTTIVHFESEHLSPVKPRNSTYA